MLDAPLSAITIHFDGILWLLLFLLLFTRIRKI